MSAHYLPMQRLNVRSRLKGIETQTNLSNLSNVVISLNVRSRLKGIETQAIGIVSKTPLRLNVRSRLKGIETNR